MIDYEYNVNEPAAREEFFLIFKTMLKYFSGL